MRARTAAAAVLAAAAAAALADHPLPGAVDPTDQEQWGIYLLNRARRDPVAYGNEIGFDLTGLTAKPPLAVNRILTGSAHFHAQEMFDHHYYGHTSEVTGDGPNAMAAENGYPVDGNSPGYSWGSTNSIESIARGVNQLPTIATALKALIIDNGVEPPGHRQHLLSLLAGYDAHREIGIGVFTGTDSFPEYNLPKLLPTRLYAIQTTRDGTGSNFMTGVVFEDRNGNLRYDQGEGLGGVTVSCADGQATTQAAGGWSIAVSPGPHVVTCEGGDFRGVARAPVTTGSQNVAIDFHSGRVGGEVSFGFRNGLPGALSTIASQFLQEGTDTLLLDVDAVNGDPTAVRWDVPWGETLSGTHLGAMIEEPGLYPIIMDAHTVGTWTSDVVVAAVASSTGAGEGTTEPASHALSAPKGLLKRNFKIAGKDQAKLSATLELPAGVRPENRTVRVCIGGACEDFQLDSRGKAVDGETGSTVLLKAKWPAEGGVAAGTIAKFTATLKGDLARALDASGIRDRTEAGSGDPIPAAVMIDGVVYTVVLSLERKSVQGKAGKGTLAAAAD